MKNTPKVILNTPKVFSISPKVNSKFNHRLTTREVPQLRTNRTNSQANTSVFPRSIGLSPKRIDSITDGMLIGTKAHVCCPTVYLIYHMSRTSMREIDAVTVRSRRLHHFTAIQQYVFESTVVHKFLKLLRGRYVPVAAQKCVSCIVLQLEPRLSIHLSPLAVSNVF